MSATTTLTEIEAINQLLSAIHESPVASLVPPLTGDVGLAQRVLDEVSSEVQAQGWSFNQEDEYPLSPDGDGFITAPTNTLKLDISPKVYDPRDVVLRGQRLYDKTNHTFVFETDLSVEIVFLLAFNELPEMARRYITAKACRKFYQRALGGDLRPVAQDEMDALAAFKDHELSTADLCLFDNPQTARPLYR